MRVAGGVAKGRRLKGATIPGARPTTELVRAAIFNVLSPMDLASVVAVDLFAGSGSLGIEALSRGARRADFVERHPRQCAAIRQNLEATGFSDVAGVYCMDATSANEVLEGPYDLVLMDPPYTMTSLDQVLTGLASSGLLAEGATVVVGHSKRLALRTCYGDSGGDLALVGSYRYGDSEVGFYVKGETPWQ